VTNDSHAGVGGQDAAKANFGFDGSVGHNDLASMKAVTHTHATAMVKTDPGRPAGRVEKRIQDWPVGDGIAAISHGFGLSVRRSDTSAIKMIATNNNRRFHQTLLYQIVKKHSGFFAFAVTEPTDTRRETLKLNALASFSEPRF
jgi:hypothetical protein